MANNRSFLKRLKSEEKKRLRLEKEEKKLERRKNSAGGDLENMLAYVDEFGNLSSKPPEKKTTPEPDSKQVTINK